MFNDNQIQQLSKDIDQNRVKTRDKAGISLQYLETYDVINEANRIFNYMWNYTITRLEEVARETNQNGNHVVTFSAIVKVKIFDSNGNFVEREDTGVGVGTARTIGDAIDNSSKSAVSDSLKRSLRTMGASFGNNLYSKTSNSQQTNHNQNFNQQASNNNYQQKQSYQHQNDFRSLQNANLQIIDNGDVLTIAGDGIFEKKEIIKNAGFRWSAQDKVWYMMKSQAA